MKKILIIMFLSLFFSNNGFADSYYFNDCKISEKYTANYLIDLKENLIKVTFIGEEGVLQELRDKIGKIKKDQIISDKIFKNEDDDAYFIYYLDVKSKSVIRQNYKKNENNLFWPYGPKSKSLCKNIKSDWDKTETTKKKKQIIKEDKSIPICKGSDRKLWKNCKGRYVTEDGSKYVGLFKVGKIYSGSVIYPGGSEYIGEFKNEKPHGEGTFTYDDGSVHIGKWKAGKGDGSGIKTWPDGKEYAGDFKDDKPHGQGTFRFPDGSKYVGEYQDGKRHGKGTLTYNDGTTYMGQFVAGYEHGEGTCFNKDGSSTECKKDIGSTKKNTHNISINGKKWIKLSKYNTSSGENLRKDFDKKARELCASIGDFNILEKKIVIIEMDETPAFGLETVIKLGVTGVIQCK